MIVRRSYPTPSPSVSLEFIVRPAFWNGFFLTISHRNDTHSLLKELALLLQDLLHLRAFPEANLETVAILFEVYLPI